MKSRAKKSKTERVSHITFFETTAAFKVLIYQKNDNKDLDSQMSDDSNGVEKSKIGSQMWQWQHHSHNQVI